MHDTYFLHLMFQLSPGTEPGILAIAQTVELQLPTRNAVEPRLFPHWDIGKDTSVSQQIISLQYKST